MYEGQMFLRTPKTINWIISPKLNMGKHKHQLTK